MVTCPQCAKLVDETTRATCPHCFTSLSGAGLPMSTPPVGQAPPGQSYPGAPGQPPAPQAYAPQLSRSGGTRVSLTGEVIDDNTNAGPPPSYVGGGAQPRQPMQGLPRPAGPAAARTAYSPNRSEAPAKSGGGGVVAAVLVVLLLLGGLGAGGWWFLNGRSNPKTVVQQFDKALAVQDWKTVYGLIELPANTKAKFPDATVFASEMTSAIEKSRANPLTSAAVDSFLTAYGTAPVGEPTITGDTATVPITMKVSFSIMGTTRDNTSTVPIPLRKVSGLWKIDWSATAFAGVKPPGAN